MKKYSFDQWCKRDWLKFSLVIAGFLLVLMLINWNNWSVSLKCLSVITALVPVHATEEWVFPGGFSYQYNLFLNKSDHPKCYPMNRASDMVTVLGTTLMYAVITLYFAISGNTVPAGIVLGAACFSTLEVVGHTFFGIKAYLTFKDKGKTTIYGVGSMTVYSGFLVLGTIMFREIALLGLSGKDILYCMVLLGIIVVFVVAPEIKFKDKESSYAYPDCGYYERFLNDKGEAER